MKGILIALLVITMGGQELSAQTKSKPAMPETVPAAIIANGKKVYTQYCLSCHMADGLGVQNMNPPLKGTTYVLGDKVRLIKIILNGLAEEIDIDGETYSNVMPAHNFLKDQEIADVLTYIRNSFGNKAASVKASEVKTARVAKK